mgnify:FL=1
MNRQDLEFMRTLKLTDGQLEYLQDLVMFAYEMNVPEQKGWDIQTFDNLVDEVMQWESNLKNHLTMWHFVT